MRRDKIIYWTATGIVCGIMAFSAVNFNLSHPFGPFEKPFPRPRFRASVKEHHEVLEHFQEAAASGNMDGLLALLSFDVVLHSDGGGKAPAFPLPIYGPNKVARAVVQGLRTLLSLKPVQRIVQVNGEPGIVSYVNGRAQSVFTLQVTDGRIEAIFIVTNPKKLSHLPPAAS